MRCGNSAPCNREPKPRTSRCLGSMEATAMRTFFGMILGALILGIGVYLYDSMSTSSVANGQTAQERRTIVNWDVAQAEWQALKTRTRDDWAKLTAQVKS